MKKRVKKLVLNTSNNSHKYLMLRNLFTSLVLYGKVETTKPRAKALKAYAQRELTRFTNTDNPLELKRWFDRNISTQKLKSKVRKQLEKIKKGFIIKDYKLKFRKGDGALVIRVELLRVTGQESQGAGKQGSVANKVETAAVEVANEGPASDKKTTQPEGDSKESNNSKKGKA